MDHSMKPVSRIALLSLALIIVTTPALAQERHDAAILFDEFGAVGGCDGSARLDNYFVELSRDPNNRGYVVGYGPEGEGSGTGKYVVQETKRYMVDVRGLDANRIEFVYGGRAADPKSIRTELYVVPPGAATPNVNRHPTRLPLVNGKYTDYQGYEGWGDGTGPPEYGNVTFAGFADLMKNQPDSVAYIVAYSYAIATPGAWRRIARRDAEDLAGRGLSADRLNIVYGGHRRSSDDESSTAYLELWLVPKGSPAPVKPADPEASPREAVLLGTHYQFELAEPGSERAIVRSFTDFLFEDPRMNACLILHPHVGGDEPDSGVAATPNVDLAALVQRWKVELRAKHGIAENRITVMVAPSEFAGGSIDVWVLPVDAPLPNPFAEEPADEVPETADTEDR